MPFHPRGRWRHRVDGGRARRQARDQHPRGAGAAVRRRPRRSRRGGRMGSGRPPQPAPEMTPVEAVADEHPAVDPGIDLDVLRRQVPSTRASRSRASSRFRSSPRATPSRRPITPSSRPAITTAPKRRATRRPTPRPRTPATLRATRKRTSTGCSRAASATSTGRSATRLTSTAPRTAAGRSPTSSSAVRPRTSRASRTLFSRRSVSRSGRVKSSSRASPGRRLGPPAGGRGRTGRRGGSAVRAVNLIPVDRRVGAGVGLGRSMGGAYALLGIVGCSP